MILKHYKQVHSAQFTNRKAKAHFTNSSINVFYNALENNYMVSDSNKPDTFTAILYTQSFDEVQHFFEMLNAAYDPDYC